MATNVKDIFDAIDSTVATTLGASFKKMPRVYSPETNDFRRIKNTYGVLHGAASSVSGVTKHYTLDQSFEVVLGTNLVDRHDDTDIQAAANDLYDKADEILNAVFLTKLGLPSIVLIVDTPSLSEPEINDNKSLLIRVGFNVKWRRAVA